MSMTIAKINFKTTTDNRQLQYQLQKSTLNFRLYDFRLLTFDFRLYDLKL